MASAVANQPIKGGGEVRERIIARINSDLRVYISK